MITVKNISFNYPTGRAVLEDISFEIPGGTVLGVAGPNGAGKSTLLKLLLNMLPPNTGHITLHNRAISTYSQKEIATNIAWIGPSTSFSFNYTVLQIVNMGLYPHANTFAERFRQSDHKALEALDLIGLSHLKDRYIHQLSSGEQQLVFLARAFVQNPRIILLDEAISHLDLHHQSQIKAILRKKNRDDGLAIVLVSHHLNFLSHFANELLFLDSGRILAYGPTKEVMTPKHLKRLYGDSVQIAESDSGIPLVYI